MPESISIRERILRVIQARLENVVDVGNVHRFDARLIQTLKHRDVVLAGGDANPEEGEQGNIGTTIKKLQVVVIVHLVPDEAGLEATDVLVSRWLARIERELMQYPQLADTQSSEPQNGEVLAIDIRLVSEYGYDLNEGVAQCAQTYEVEYQHDRDNPYVGPGITELTE